MRLEGLLHEVVNGPILLDTERFELGIRNWAAANQVELRGEAALCDMS